MDPQEEEEIVVAPPSARDAITLATHVRSTLLLSSLQTLRARHLFEAYSARLDGPHREVILSGVAGVWLPMEVGLAHYWACNSLNLPLSDEIMSGHEVANRIQGSVLGLLVRAAKNAGATPWTVLGYVDRLWDRVFKGGGGVRVVKIGPKEARAELLGLPLLAVPYFRHAYRGAFHAGLAVLCQKIYVTEVPLRFKTMRAESCVAFRISWA